MAGHMGDISVSVKNLEVVGLDKVKNLLVIKGAIPGPTGSLVEVTKLGRIRGYIAPPEEKPSEEEEQEAKAAEGGENQVKEATEIIEPKEEVVKEGDENAKS